MCLFTAFYPSFLDAIFFISVFLNLLSQLSLIHLLSLFLLLSLFITFVLVGDAFKNNTKNKMKFCWYFNGVSRGSECKCVLDLSSLSGSSLVKILMFVLMLGIYTKIQMLSLNCKLNYQSQNFVVIFPCEIAYIGFLKFWWTFPN